MSYLGFTGDEKNIVTQSLQRLNRFGAPWISVCVAAFPGALAFLAASDEPYLVSLL
jgi:amino acid permease